MEESGKLTLSESEETLFVARLTEALQNGGDLLIRQILPKSIVQETKFYSFSLGKNKYKPMSEKTIRLRIWLEKLKGILLKLKLFWLAFLLGKLKKIFCLAIMI